MPISPSERAAAQLLQSNGFGEVRFVAAEPASRTADLVAEKDGTRWAIEVRTSSRPLRADASFEPEGAKPLPYPTLEDYFALLWREKRAQLEATRASEGCGAAMLLVMAAGEPSAEWERALERAWLAAGRPDVRFAVGGAGRLVTNRYNPGPNGRGPSGKAPENHWAHPLFPQ
jgi:hypothetical protein